MIRKKNILLLVFLICFYQLSIAANVNYRVGALIANYDNVNLVTGPVEKEISREIYAGLSLFEDTSDLYLNIDGNARSLNYVNNIASDRTTGNLIANIIWRIKPNHFEWYLDNNFTESLVNPLLSDSTSNRQNVNVFSTGPNYILRLNSRYNFQLEARAERYNYERDFDNNRGFTAVRLQHDMNSALNISLNNEVEIVRFDNEAINNDFDRFDTFLGVNYSRGVTVINAEYGSTKISNKIRQDNNIERYLFSIDNLRSRASSVRLDYEYILSDTGRQVSNLTSVQISNNSPLNSASNDLFVDETFRLRYMSAFSVGNISYEILTGTRSYYTVTELDVEVDGILINGSWFVNGRNNLFINLRYSDSVYIDPSINREDNDYRYSIVYTHRLKREYNFGIEMISLERKSNIDTSSYDDFRVIFSINYLSQ